MLVLKIRCRVKLDLLKEETHICYIFFLQIFVIDLKNYLSKNWMSYIFFNREN